jgi:nucleoside-diphosphate kinase
LEKTLILIKPDARKRGIEDTIILRFTRKGFKIVKTILFKPSRDLVEEHYIEHKGKEFFNDLVDSLADKYVHAMILERENAVVEARKLIGATKPELQVPGTIRGDFALNLRENSVHGSDSIEAANREIELWFGKNLLMGDN